MKTPRRMLVLRIIAAANVPAFEEEAEVDPYAANGETFLATFRRAWRDVAHRVEMRAFHAHGKSLGTGDPAELRLV
jgi:hypothetical protein